MGSSVAEVLRDVDDIELVAANDRECPLEEAGAALVPAAVTTSLPPDVEVDVVIDFTAPAAAQATSALAVERGAGLVIGTTALEASDLQALRRAAQRIPIVHSPNMSIGVNLLFELTRRTAETLAGYDVELVEMHHRSKRDAPSGTALRLLEILDDARGPMHRRHGRQGATSGRPPDEVGVHALRGGDVTGDHLLIFAGEGERVELTHRATSRRAFALGAVMAIRFVVGREPGIYSMRDVLGFDG